MNEPEKEELRELSTRLLGLEMNFKAVVRQAQEQIDKIAGMRATIHNLVSREEIMNRDD
jgi:hypothetical protein